MNHATMNRLFACCFVFLAATTFTLKAEPAAVAVSTTIETIKTVSGIVTDATNSEPLAGVTLECSGKKYYSDLEGKFTLTTPAASQEKVDISLISYQSSSVDLEANVSTLNVSIKQR